MDIDYATKIVNILLGAVGVVSLFIGYCTVRVNQKVANETKRMVDLNKENTEKQLRSYVFIDHVMEFSNTNAFFIMKNIGQTLATKIEVQVHLYIEENTYDNIIDIKSFTKKNGRPRQDFMLAPNSAVRVNVVVDDDEGIYSITQAHLNGDKKRTYYLHGSVTYCDIFNERRETIVLLKLNPDGYEMKNNFSNSVSAADRVQSSQWMMIPGNEVK